MNAIAVLEFDNTTPHTLHFHNHTKPYNRKHGNKGDT